MIKMEGNTPYDWSLESNMRVLTLSPTDENWYYTEIVTKEDFLVWLGTQTIKPNSTPRKTEMYLEYRMYGLVPYNISPIQAGIQFGHGKDEYQQNCRGMGRTETIFNLWATEYKTYIIYNGGTTNNDSMSKWYGSMQKYRDQLEVNNILFSEFYEPDLNNALTSVNLLADERVFDRELYPDYVDMPYPWKDKGRGYKPSDKEMDKWEVENMKNRAKWVEKIGGEKNDFLRTFLRAFRLANN